MRGIVQALEVMGALKSEDVADELVAITDDDVLHRTLVERGLVTDAQIAEAVALHSGFPYLDLNTLTLDSEIVALVPGTLCRRHRLIPLSRTDGRLTVAIEDPTDLRALDDVASITGLVVEPVVVSASALDQAMARHVRSDDELSELSTALGETAEVASLFTGESFEEHDATAPVVRFVNLLIAQAISDRASDIHVEPGERDLVVRYRIDGVLHEVQRADRAIRDGVVSRLKIMSSIDIAERRRPQDGRLSVEHDGRSVDLRVATLPTVWGEKIVLRILDTTTQRMSLDDLDLSPPNSARLRAAIQRPYGMVLATGPTGSGKSTTTYAALDHVTSPQVSVVTVEDPVEYRVSGINQVQVNPKAGLTFAHSLRAILRIDPDIILVGEIRDHETAITSIEAALTGHLVFSTLHTNDAPSALTRLVEIGAEPYLVGGAITAVIGQRLTRRLCLDCREPMSDAADTLDALGIPFDSAAAPVIYAPRGCALCAHTGYRGRIALHEVMEVTERIEHDVIRGASASALRQTALDEGMVGLREDGWAKAFAGLTSLQEVLRVTV